MPTFLALEQAGGEPIEIVVFARGTQVWRYCSSDQPLTIGGITYQPAALQVGTHTDSNENTSASVVVSLSRTTQVVTDALIGPPPSYLPLIATIFRHQVGATGSDPVTAFLGEVTTWTFKGDTVECTVSLAPLDFERAVPRMMMARTCQNALYDGRCGLDPENFAINVTVSAINADGSLVLSAIPGGTVATGQYKRVSPYQLLLQAPPIAWGFSPTGFFTVSGTAPNFVITLLATAPGSGPYGVFTVNSDDTLTVTYNTPLTAFGALTAGFYSLDPTGKIITFSATQVSGAYFYTGGYYLFNGYAVAIAGSGGNGSAPVIFPLGPNAPGLVATDTIRLYRGCDKTIETCINTFNNLTNFIGFPNIPDRDAFVDGII